MKGLEALNVLKKVLAYFGAHTEKAIEGCNIIEKELKALEILKKTLYLELVFEDNHHFIDASGGGYLLTQEEYELLKEVLE